MDGDRVVLVADIDPDREAFLRDQDAELMLIGSMMNAAMSRRFSRPSIRSLVPAHAFRKPGLEAKMTLHASWIHGNAVTVESPQNLKRVGHFGWGGDMQFIPGRSSWLHIPLPTPVIVGNVRTTIQKVFLMFMTENCKILNVHIFDGSSKVQEFNDLLHHSGEHRTGLDGENTFILTASHVVAFGMGITFFVQAEIGFDAQTQARLMVSSAGGDFITA